MPRRESARRLRAATQRRGVPPGLWHGHGCTTVRLHQPPDAAKCAWKLEPATVSGCDGIHSLEKWHSRRQYTVEHRVTRSDSHVRAARQPGRRTGPNTDEIVRPAPPVRTVYSQLPAGANVNVTNPMMVDAASDESNWLLHGRTYDNQRYSPLRQITSDNVKSLSPVALVQTGMTASFETTPIVVNGVMYITTPVVNKRMLIMAVNAATGERLWEVTYNLGPFQVCCGPVNRGVAVGFGQGIRRYPRRSPAGTRRRRRPYPLGLDHCQFAVRLFRDARAADLRWNDHRWQRRR